METDIRYLELVRGDLADAGRRAAERRRRPTLRDGGPARVLVAASLATLLVAGAIGWWVTSGGIAGDSANESGGGATGSTGGDAATGATGAADEFGPVTLPGIEHQGGAPAPAATPAPSDDSGAGGSIGSPDTSVSRVIRTAEISLVIPRDSFDERFADASEIASANGGYVQDSGTRERSGDLTMRVPAANFDDALAGLRELGDVDVQRIQGRDVTADYVDLHARLRIAKSRREVLLRLMDTATTIEQTIRVQNALDDTQLRIEEIQGQLNLLDDRTSLATIRLDLREQGVQRTPEVEKASIPNAFERSVAGFVGVIAGIVVGLGYLLPPILIGLAAWAVVIVVRRRRTA